MPGVVSSTITASAGSIDHQQWIGLQRGPVIKSTVRPRRPSSSSGDRRSSVGNEQNSSTGRGDISKRPVQESAALECFVSSNFEAGDDDGATTVTVDGQGVYLYDITTGILSSSVLVSRESYFSCAAVCTSGATAVASDEKYGNNVDEACDSTWIISATYERDEHGNHCKFHIEVNLVDENAIEKIRVREECKSEIVRLITVPYQDKGSRRPFVVIVLLDGRIRVLNLDNVRKSKTILAASEAISNNVSEPLGDSSAKNNDLLIDAASLRDINISHDGKELILCLYSSADCQLELVKVPFRTADYCRSAANDVDMTDSKDTMDMRPDKVDAGSDTIDTQADASDSKTELRTQLDVAATDAFILPLDSDRVIIRSSDKTFEYIKFHHYRVLPQPTTAHVSTDVDGSVDEANVVHADKVTDRIAKNKIEKQKLVLLAPPLFCAPIGRCDLLLAFSHIVAIYNFEEQEVRMLIELDAEVLAFVGWDEERRRILLLTQKRKHLLILRLNYTPDVLMADIVGRIPGSLERSLFDHSSEFGNKCRIIDWRTAIGQIQKDDSTAAAGPDCEQLQKLLEELDRAASRGDAVRFGNAVNDFLMQRIDPQMDDSVTDRHEDTQTIARGRGQSRADAIRAARASRAMFEELGSELGPRLSDLVSALISRGVRVLPAEIDTCFELLEIFGDMNVLLEADQAKTMAVSTDSEFDSEETRLSSLITLIASRPEQLRRFLQSAVLTSQETAQVLNRVTEVAQKGAEQATDQAIERTTDQAIGRATGQTADEDEYLTDQDTEHGTDAPYVDEHVTEDMQKILAAAVEKLSNLSADFLRESLAQSMAQARHYLFSWLSAKIVRHGLLLEGNGDAVLTVLMSLMDSLGPLSLASSAATVASVREQVAEAAASERGTALALSFVAAELQQLDLQPPKLKRPSAMPAGRERESVYSLKTGSQGKSMRSQLFEQHQQVDKYSLERLSY